MENKYREIGLEDWYGPHAYKDVYTNFLKVFKEDQIYISQAGFEP